MLKMFAVALAVVLLGAVVYIGLFLLRERRRARPTLGLRSLALHLTPAKAGLEVRPGEPFGVIMETAFDRGVATLLALSDGSASLYFSTGGGVIGGKADAARRCVAAAAMVLPQLTPVTDDAFPPLGRTRFHILIPEGRVGGEAESEALAGGAHALSPLFFAGQDVITELRLATQHYNAGP
jgi:hypothetical protein